MEKEKIVSNYDKCNSLLKQIKAKNTDEQKAKDIVDVEEYIEKKRNNNERLNWDQEMDLLLAAVLYKIKTAQNFSKNDESVNKILEKALDNFSKNAFISICN